MKVYLVFPDFTQDLDASEVEPGVVELRQHSGFIPLGPGDVVRVDQSGDITDVVSLEPMFTYEVTFHLPADIVPGKPLPDTHRVLKALAKVEEEWRRDAYVTRTTNFNVFVSSQSRRWLEDKVAGHKFVEHIELRRTPDLELNLPVALAHRDRDGSGGGPWA